MSVEDAARVTTARAKKRFPTRPRARKLYTADPTVKILLCQRGNPAPVQAFVPLVHPALEGTAAAA